MMSQQFRAMNMAMSTVIDSFQSLQDATSEAIDITALEAAQRELRQVEANFNQIENEIKQAEDAQEKFNRDIQRADDLASKLLGTLAAVAGTYISFQALGKAIEVSDEYTNTTARVNLLVDDKPISKSVDYMKQVVDDLNSQILLNADLDASKVQQEIKAIEEKLITVDVQTDGSELTKLSSHLSQIRTELGVDVSVYGMSELELAQQMIFDAAQRSYSSFKDTADMVSRIGTNAGDVFDSLEEVVAFSELVQKQFTIAGANAIEASNATLQLSQALASGVLRGDELNSIFEQAPNLIRTIADYMEVPIGAIREMAANGEITADIVKNAMFAAADDINAKFESMPVTWAQIWTSFQNEALWAFRPVLEEINAIANSEKFQAFVNDVVQSLEVLAQVALYVIDILSTAGGFIYDNWAFLGPIIFGVAGAVGVLATALIGAKLATLAMTAAQWALNTAMALNPITWVIAALVLLIGLFFAAIEVINHFAGTNLSAIGLIVGAYAFMYSVFYNVIAYMLNSILSFAEFWVNVWRHPVYTIKRYFANLANSAIDMATSMIGSFDSAATNLANMFISGANMAIRAINWVIDALNKIPGIDLGKMSEFSLRTSLTADYSGLKNVINDWVGEMPEDYWEAPRLKYMSPLDNAIRGHEWGANLFSGFDLDLQNQERFNMEEYMKDILNSVNGLGDAIDVGNGSAKDTAGNTGKLADSVDLLEEDMKYLRDAANTEAINRFTTGHITVDMRGMQNNIGNDMDIDGIIEKIVVGVEESIDSLPEGV